MSLARFRVLRAGPATTLQDAGRPGFARYGVPASGPMDRMAFALANAGVGNPAGATLIEVSTGGLVLGCEQGALTVALAGGAFRLSVDGVARGDWAVASIRAGQRLEIRAGTRGAWACLAFAGRITARHWLGAAATHGPSGFGGGLLAEGDEIAVEDPALHPEREGPLPVPPEVRDPPAEIRVVTGPQDRFFAPETLAAFLAGPFAPTEARDRMGVRLAGPALPPAAALDMPSEPVARGSVQVAGDGVATVLLADHQTTGGYPKIATVISADLDALAQLRPGDGFRFAAVTPEAAVTAARARARLLAARTAEAAEAGGDLSRRLLRANLVGGVVDAHRAGND